MLALVVISKMSQRTYCLSFRIFFGLMRGSFDTKIKIKERYTASTFDFTALLSTFIEFFCLLFNIHQSQFSSRITFISGFEQSFRTHRGGLYETVKLLGSPRRSRSPQNMFLQMLSFAIIGGRWRSLSVP